MFSAPLAVSPTAGFILLRIIERETGAELLCFLEVNTFQVILGGNRAPFGKEDMACAWLVSFLNRGKHVLSSNENFMIFGANCSEDTVVV